MKKYISFIYEIYSLDSDEIIDFLDELPDIITLYRGIFVEKGRKINKRNLGINWSLDYDFVSKLPYQKSFEFDYDEDYDLCIVIADFNKNDIDIEKTIHKRTNMIWQNEDEIIVKQDSKPKIIDIEYIEIDSDIQKIEWDDL
jgi:hypothetical protein